MHLYLLRHAHALDHANDEVRVLSSRGHREVDALAQFLKRSGAFRPDEIWHSPYLRAHETATRLAAALGLAAPLVPHDTLTPDSDPRKILQRLARAPERVVLVGHEPHLGGLASLLLTGQTERGVFAVEKCALLAFEGRGSSWMMRWHVSPELLTTH